jgi:hypothetical protein
MLVPCIAYNPTPEIGAVSMFSVPPPVAKSVFVNVNPPESVNELPDRTPSQDPF